MRTPVVLVLVLVLMTGLAVAGGVAAAPAAAVTPLSATLQGTFTGQATQTFYDQLGTAVAVSGDTALLGAQYFQDTTKDPDPYHTGEVYVYVRSGGAWTQEAVLTAPDETDASYFGCSVAIEGDTAVVGAYGHLGTAGSVYVFTRSAGVWSLQQRLDGPVHSQMGYSVAIAGDTLLAGAPAYYYVDPDPILPQGPTTGAARVYARTGDVWTFQQQLEASDPAEADRFGWSVGLDGDSAVVGAPFKNGGIPNGAGAAYVFTRAGGAWTQQLKVAGGTGSNLGRSVAVSGQTALAGAPLASSNTGKVVVLGDTGSGWAWQTEFTSADMASGGLFGFSVALSGDLAFVGASERASGGVSYSGAAYAFGRSGSAWIQQTRIDPPAPAALMHFGYAVAVDGATAVAGEPSTSNHYTGHAYAYLLTPTTDTTPPVTTPQVSPPGWTNKPVTVTLAATDDFSGVATTQYKLADAAVWETYTGPFQVTSSGVANYVCRSIDGAAIPNTEADVPFTVYRDLSGPATQALANVTAKAGKRASFRFKVTDVTPKATVTLKVFKGSRVKKTVKVGSRATGSAQSYSWNCGLPRGTYTWKVYATDQAGNAQVRMRSKSLTVK
jgi:hypothetical protein